VSNQKSHLLLQLTIMMGVFLLLLKLRILQMKLTFLVFAVHLPTNGQLPIIQTIEAQILIGLLPMVLLKLQKTHRFYLKTQVNIQSVEKVPTVAIDTIPNLCGTAASISPIASVENCTINTTGISYNWTFTEGIPATATTLIPGEIEYNKPGIYEATLKVTNECGVFITAVQTFEVIEKPVILGSDT